MKILKLMSAVLAFVGAAGAWSSVKADEVPAQVRTFFESIDLNRNGGLSQRELNISRDAILVSMDSDENDVVDENEFVAWGIGESALAFETKQSDELRAAKLDFFKNVLDRNSDGKITENEFLRGFFLNYVYGDSDNNGSLSVDEFFANDPLFQRIADVLRRG